MAHQPYKEEFLRVNGATTRLRIGGEGGRDLVWLHGLFSEPRWMAHHDALAKSFRVFSPDLPGYGKSEEGDIETIDDLSFWLLEFLKETSIGKPILMGHSIGGWVAAHFAVHWPKLLSKIILLSPAGLRVSGFNPPDIMMTQVPLKLSEYLFADENVAKEVLPDTEVASQAQLEEFYIDYGRTMKLAWDPFLYDPKLKKRLKYISVPALIIWGQSDRIFSAEHGKMWNEGIADSRLEMIHGSGHYSHLEKTGIVLEKVKQFAGVDEA